MVAEQPYIRPYVVLTLSKPLAAGKELELINAVEPGPAPAEADESRMQQHEMSLSRGSSRSVQAG